MNNANEDIVDDEKYSYLVSVDQEGRDLREASISYFVLPRAFANVNE